MRVTNWAVLAAAGLLVTLPAVSQVVAPPKSDFTARFSYQVSGRVAGQSGGLRMACFAFAPDGEYRILRDRSGSGREAFQGKLSKSQQDQLQQMLNSAAFRALTGNGAGTVITGAETFIAKVPRQEKEQYVVWTNRDGRDPFPNAAAGLIDWISKFDSSGSQRIRPLAEDVCPYSARPLMPSGFEVRTD